MKQFSQKFNSRHLVPASIDPLRQICKFYKIQDGGGRHLEFQKMLITSAWLKQFSKIQDGGGRHRGFRKMLIISA